MLENLEITTALELAIGEALPKGFALTLSSLEGRMLSSGVPAFSGEKQEVNVNDLVAERTCFLAVPHKQENHGTSSTAKGKHRTITFSWHTLGGDCPLLLFSWRSHL